MIYTFYSYKGGVGRSMALANLAKWFYMHGLRVVIVDWDLEAPGLENYFFDPDDIATPDQIRRAQDRPGVIDLLITYQRRFPALPIPPWSKTLIKVLHAALPAKLPEPLAHVDKDQLLKVLDQLLAPGLRPAFDKLNTKSALDVLAKYLPSELSGLSTRRDEVIEILKQNLPAVLNTPFDQVDTNDVLTVMEKSWTSTPPFLSTKDNGNEPDVSALLQVVRANLTTSDISFEETYVGPLLNLLEESLPPFVPPFIEDTTLKKSDTTSPKGIPTETLLEAVAKVLPADFIVTLRQQYAQALLNALKENLPPFSSMLFPIYKGDYSEDVEPSSANRSDSNIQPAGGGLANADRQPGLWLLSAGWRFGERFSIYAQNVQSFDWTGFYNAFEGEAYFEWMRHQLNDFADIVLIDSRTGVTEMGGVCTRQLADVVVSFVAPNGQNLTGVATMVESIQRQEVAQSRKKWENTGAALNGYPEVVVIPARVETSEVNLRNQFEARFSREIDDPPESFQKVSTSFWDLKIPYVPYFSYNERIVMGIRVGGTGRSEELENAYKKLAVHLTILAPERSLIRKCVAADLQDAFPNLIPGMALIVYAQGEHDLADQLCKKLEAEGITFLDDLLPLPEDRGAQPEFLRQLEQSSSLIIVASNETVASSVVLRQWRLARQHGKCVYLIGQGLAEPHSLGLLPNGAEIFDSDSEWKRLADKLRTPCRASRAPQMAPAPPDRYFAHADDLLRLKSIMLSLELDSSPRSHADVAICGMGGSGKSVLAASFCYDEEVLNYFSGGVLWLRLGPNPNVFQLLSDVYSSITGSLSPFANADLIAGDLGRRLMDQNCLMVVDDVWSKQDLQLFIKARANCGMIIITRDQALATEIANRVMMIGGISSADAVEIITSKLKNLPIGDENLERYLVPLVERLGLLPLAVELAGSALRRRLEQGDRINSAVEYLQQALDVQGVIAFDRTESTERESSVKRTLELSLKQLTADEFFRYTKLARFKENEKIPLEAISQMWRVDGFRTEQLVQELSYRSLLRFDPEQKTVTLNPLLRSYLEKTLRVPVSKEEPRPTGESENVRAARNFLRGQSGSGDQLYKLAMKLKTEKQFGFARRLLIKAKKDPSLNDNKAQLLKINQQLSLTTRKDPDLPRDERLKLAFEILKEAEDLNTTKTQETLGLAGAIFKNMWEFDGQKQHLERSLVYYLRGYNVGVASDFGYTSINAAYVLDLLADQEAQEAERAGSSSDLAQARRKQAESIRQEIVERLPRLPYDKDANGNTQNWLLKEWWFLVTLAEAFFGLKRYDQALYWLNLATSLPNVPEWEYESTARQLVSIARLNDEISETSDREQLRESKVWEVLRVFLKNDLDAVRSSLIGKVGLALSGGGFRASLFHIGVLAKLAELDVLRKVEVLSCVSGGSIIGAHYYLEVRKLLQSKNDADISRADYIQIVKQIEKDFLAGVQRNLRTRVAADIVTNLKMIFVPNYSRTERIGELYENEIFSRALDNGDGKLVFNKLTVQPLDGPENFRPRNDNWRRATKVPILILNATTLNTGHNWQFTASWMGEPPSSINTEVDGNDRLRRMYYHQAPKPHNDIRLGQAVAASACVPGLFEPLALSNLYPEKTVRLVDGGVHDNQGIAGLLGEECTLLLVSDASGQMATINNPGPGPFGVSLRSNGILMARVRESEYRELDALRRASLLRGLMFIHLKKDLEVDPVDWVGCDDTYESFDESHTAERRGVVTSYGVRKDIQQSLSGIRTDLDSFSDKEAYALMLSGYRMAGHEFAECIKGFPTQPDERPEWRFLAIEKQMDRVKGFEDAHKNLTQVLNVGNSRALKVWKLTPILPAFFLLIAFVIIATLLWVYMTSEWLQFAVAVLRRIVFGLLTGIFGGVGKLLDSLSSTLITPVGAVVVTVIGIASLIIGWRVIQTIQKRKPLGQIAVGLVMATVGWIAATIHLHVFDKLYLRQGRVD